MRSGLAIREIDHSVGLDHIAAEVLAPEVERALLRELAECKAKLTEALARLEGVPIPQAGDDPQLLARYMAQVHSGGGPEQARLGAVYRRYAELRDTLAMANVKLVAHVAKRFRSRGVALSDLMQEGFCGLLEAIDRFDLAHQTKLATYATWWIRQAMQSAVASGAYPVRLTPRHLRQLAEDQERSESRADGAEVPASGTLRGLIPFIQAAIRPAVSLDSLRSERHDFSLLQTIADPEDDPITPVDLDEMVARLMQALRPREQEVLTLRFGLGGGQRRSLSQVGKVLAVSKERVRQIEDRALQKLRALADEQDLAD